MTVDKNMIIEMDPEIAEAYAASTAISSKYLELYKIFQY